MSTEFNHNIAMLVPAALYSEAGAIIACISGQAVDLMQFGQAKYLPDYDACNAQAKESHAMALRAAGVGQLHPARPDFDIDEEIDMVAVQAAIDGAQYVFEIPEGGIVPVPGAIIVGLDIDAAALAAACGFVRIAE